MSDDGRYECRRDGLILYWKRWILLPNGRWLWRVKARFRTSLTGSFVQFDFTA